MESTCTEIDTDIHRPVVGYVPLAFFDEENQRKVALFQKKLEEKFPNTLWTTPPEMLHITLMDWLAPLVQYEKDKDVHFGEIFEEYDVVLKNILSTVGKIDISFTTLNVKSRAIFLSGKDNGQMQYIRDRFLSEITLLPNTKKPPTIIHSTLARFVKKVELEEVEKFVSEQSLVFSQSITEFHLARISTMYQTNKEDVVKKYPLL